MTSVNVTSVTNTVTVVEGDTTVVTVTTAGPQGATGTVAAAASGTAAAPGITFISDPNTGIYNPSADNLSFSTGGVQRLSIASDGTVNVVGNLTEGGNNVVSVADTGTVTSTMILDGTIVNGDINASAAIVDTKLATISTAGKVSNSATTATNANTASAIVARDGSGNFSAGTITAALTGAASSNVLKAGDTMTGPLLVPAGTAALPGLAVSGDANTGIYSPGADQVAISTGGSQRLQVAANGQILAGNGSGANPAYSFISDPYTGIVSVSSAILGIATNGQTRTTFNSGTIDTTGSLLLGTFNSGDWAALTFRGNRSGAGSNLGQINFSNNGSVRTSITTGIDSATPTDTNLVFSTSASERLRITSAGNVGIGTSSPSSKLDVVGNVNITTASAVVPLSITHGYNSDIFSITRNTGTGRSIFITETGFGPSIQISKTTTATTSNSNSVGVAITGNYSHNGSEGSGRGLDIAVTNNTATSGILYGGIVSATANSSGSTAVGLSVTTASTSGTKYAALFNGGNVGIGTTSPSRLLTLYDAGTLTYLQLAHSGASGTSRGLELVLNSNEANIINREAGGLFLSTAGGPITFGSAGERARIDSSGRLLIGTSSFYTIPDTQFGNAWEKGINLRFGNGDAGYGGLAIINDNGIGNARSADLALCRAASTSTYGAVASGSLIGSVTFNGADGSKFVRAASIRAEVDGTPGANDMPGRLVFSTTADGAASPTERMRIDSSGNIGIASTTPTAKLEIGGSVSSGNTRAAYFRYPSDSANPARTTFEITANESGAEKAVFRVMGDGSIQGNTFAGVVVRNSAGTEIARFQDAGLKFPATQVASADPNTLDDYEEGTFTPTVIGTSTAGTATYSIQGGNYTKIGRLVTYTIYLEYTAGTGSGSLSIGGLPFTSGGAYHPVAFGLIQNMAIAANTVLGGYTNAGTATIACTNLPVGAATFGGQAYDAAAAIILSGTYFV